jgi:hypothetical protein
MSNSSSRSSAARSALPSVASIPPVVPVRVPREEAARLVSLLFFQVSHRTLERWPLRWKLLNNRAHVDTGELFAYAGARVAEAPVVKGGTAN